MSKKVESIDIDSKYKIGNEVTILGLDDIKYIVEGIQKDNEYSYIYVLKVCNNETYTGENDISKIQRLNWIPECMIV